jgi:hypothetical protein
MLKDEIYSNQEGNSPIPWVLGHCGVEITGRADSEVTKSVKEGRDSKTLLTVADLKS